MPDEKEEARRLVANVGVHLAQYLNDDLFSRPEYRKRLESMGAQAKDPESMKGLDDYPLSVAEKRRKGTVEY